jgi:hypothetical protein
MMLKVGGFGDLLIGQNPCLIIVFNWLKFCRRCIPQLDDEQVQVTAHNIGGYGIFMVSIEAFEIFNFADRKMLARRPSLSELTGLSTETELLWMFWRQRIVDNDNHHLLELYESKRLWWSIQI